MHETRNGRPAFRTSPSILEPARPEVFNFRFAADREFKDKFERLAEVLGVENSLQHMAEIMEQAQPVMEAGDMARIEAAIPLGRIASARDVAGPIVFLCSPLARHITGEILNVYGGAVLVG